MRGIGWTRPRGPSGPLVDRVLALCVEWRETTRAVAETCRPWCLAPAGEEAGRFAAYLAAPDQEQTVAGLDAESISELERGLPDSDRGSEPRAAPG